ncbi:MAG: hypothetical protein NY202_02130 [Mollicutes bacterium UO1]
MFVNKFAMEEVNRQIIEILIKIGSEKVKDAINSHVSANKNRAIELWEGKGDKKKNDEIGFIEKCD